MISQQNHTTENVTLNVSESNTRKYFMKLNLEITDEKDGPIISTDRTI